MPALQEDHTEMHSGSRLMALAAMTGAFLSGGAALAATINNPFDIQVSFGSGLSVSQQSVFTDAELFWETMITGNRYDLALPALQISADSAPDDGVGGVLGSAGPSTIARTNGAPQDYTYALSGNMNFDSADIANMESSGILFDVIVHEMAHVIGFGTLWNPIVYSSSFAGTQSVYTDGTGQYTGSYALLAYNLEFGLSTSYVPVELDFGPGTANGHWDEATFAGGSLDIMTGLIGNPTAAADAPFAATTVSATTIASFADIGYTTVVTDPVSTVPLPAAMVFSLIGLAGLGAVSARRRRAAA